MLPGRLRLRFTQLKQSPGMLALVCNDLRAVAGVTAVDASALTGGVLIQYEGVVGSASRFWNEIDAVLLAYHPNHEPRPFGRQARMRDAELVGGAGGIGGIRLARKFSDGAAGALLERLIERSAVALVARLF